MGANYDMILTPTCAVAEMGDHFAGFLASLGRHVAQPMSLTDCEIEDEHALLISPPVKGWAQILASASATGVDLTTWFHHNPLAVHLSKVLGICVHIWSLDSGFVIGYTVYAAGTKAESDLLFCTFAKDHRDLMDGVTAPDVKEGDFFRELLGKEFAFRSEMARFKNLEIGLAHITSSMDFEAHLVDLHDAIDDKVGIAVSEGKYLEIRLRDWIVFPFSSS